MAVARLCSWRLTSGPGRHRLSGRRRAGGFTLIELLVALVIAAVIVSVVAVSSAPSPERALQTDADRLAQLLALAREEAQIRGVLLSEEEPRGAFAKAFAQLAEAMATFEGEQS